MRAAPLEQQGNTNRCWVTCISLSLAIRKEEETMELRPMRENQMEKHQKMRGKRVKMSLS